MPQFSAKFFTGLDPLCKRYDAGNLSKVFANSFKGTRAFNVLLISVKVLKSISLDSTFVKCKI